MVTRVYHHPDFAGHVTPPGHPEQVARLAAVERGLSDLPVERHKAPIAADDEVLRCHPAAYLAKVRRAVPTEGWVALDGETMLAPGSLTAALRAVGGIAAAVDAVMAGQAQNAFVAGRPPGHHAETATAMGFCLFGTVAIAAKRLLDHHGLSRVAIVDFDVHHGNGTQAIFEQDRRVLFASSHQWPLYPGTGARNETGVGNIVNAPLPPNADGTQFRAAWSSLLLPAVSAFRPQLLLVSAGFDGHRRDPLAELQLEAADYGWLSRELVQLANRHCGGRIVSMLEGGYDLQGLAESSVAHVRELLA